MRKLIEDEVRNMVLVEQKTEYVPTIYETYWDQSSNLCLIIMEHIKGTSLRKILEDSNNATSVSMHQNLEIFKRLCYVVSRIHSVDRFYHKDLKPENIIVNRDIGSKPIVHVIDFGISGPTRFKNVGTKAYMAPEQREILKFISPCQATDIFSLGLIGYEMFTGRVPEISIDFKLKFGSDKWSEIPSISKENQDLNVAKKLEMVINKALALKPMDRYRNAGELYSAVKSIRL
jgi:serine/threonine-protein kinase